MVNLAARWGKNEPNEAIWQSNFEFPTSIATRIRDKTQWIQVDSYFNLYFDKYGADKDYYSQSKRVFYESLLKHGEYIDPIQVIAPHLVGPHESQNRIFRVVTSALAKNESYPLGSGKQYLPFLHISDTVNQLLNVVTNSSFGDSKRVHLRISGQMTVHELVFQSHKRFNRSLTLAKFGEIPEPEAEFYEPVEMFQDHSLFPPPKIDLGQILDEQYQERLDERVPEN